MDGACLTASPSAYRHSVNTDGVLQGTSDSEWLPRPFPQQETIDQERGTWTGVQRVTGCAGPSDLWGPLGGPAGEPWRRVNTGVETCVALTPDPGRTRLTLLTVGGSDTHISLFQTLWNDASRR